MATERLRVILEMVTGQYKREAVEAATATRGIASSAEKTGAAAAGMGRKLDRATGGLTGLAAGGLAAKQAFDFTVGAAVSFDQKMTESLAIMGDVSDAMRNDMAQAAREVAKQTTFSADQAAESYFFLASAGLDAQQSIQALPAVARFAQAGMFDMALATDLATDAQSALGLATDNAGTNLANLTRVTDVFTKANALANTSVQQIAEAMTNKAGAALRAVNKDIEEGSAVLAALADQGVKGAAAGESLNIVLRDLQRSALDNADAFATAGISVFDQAGNMRNLADIIGDVEERLDGMSDAQVRAELTTLGFQDKSVSNLLTLLGTSEAIREYERELRSAGGATEEVANKQLESAAAQWELFKSELADVGLEIGESLLPALKDTLPVLQDSVPLLMDAASALQVIADLGSIGGGFDPFPEGFSAAMRGQREEMGGVERLLHSMGIAVARLHPGMRQQISDATEVAEALMANALGLQHNIDSMAAARGGYSQLSGDVGAADRALLNMAARTGDVNDELGKMPAAVGRTSGPLGGLIGQLLEAQAAAESMYGTLRSASDPVFAAVDAWQRYGAAVEAAGEDGAGAGEQFDVLRAKADLNAALENLGSNWDSAMQAIALATNTPIAQVQALFEDLMAIDGQTFRTTIETSFITSGTPTIPGSRAGGAAPRQQGGGVERHGLYRTGERNSPEMMFIPGDRGRLFSYSDTRALMQAVETAAHGGQTMRGGDFVVHMQSQDPVVDAARVGALRAVQRRMEAR